MIPDQWDTWHVIRILHSVIAYTTLIVIFLPLFTPKGSRVHKLSGRIFAAGTVFIGVSAIGMITWRYLFDPYDHSFAFVMNLNLIFDSVFMLTCVWYGVLVLRNKERTKPSYSIWHIGPPLFSLFLGLFEQMVAIKNNNILFMLFPILPNIASYFQIKYWITAPTQALHWRSAHRSGMLCAMTAVIVGFTITGAQVFAPYSWPHPLEMYLPVWLGPPVIHCSIVAAWELWQKRKKAKNAQNQVENFGEIQSVT